MNANMNDSIENQSVYSSASISYAGQHCFEEKDTHKKETKKRLK
jgi:hypothetical protein